jgi:hypothetical protein
MTAAFAFGAKFARYEVIAGLHDIYMLVPKPQITNYQYRYLTVQRKPVCSGTRHTRTH